MTSGPTDGQSHPKGRLSATKKCDVLDSMRIEKRIEWPFLCGVFPLLRLRFWLSSWHGAVALPVVDPYDERGAERNCTWFREASYDDVREPSPIFFCQEKEDTDMPPNVGPSFYKMNRIGTYPRLHKHWYTHGVVMGQWLYVFTRERATT